MSGRWGRRGHGGWVTEDEADSRVSRKTGSEREELTGLALVVDDAAALVLDGDPVAVVPGLGPGRSGRARRRRGLSHLQWISPRLETIRVV